MQQPFCSTGEYGSSPFCNGPQTEVIYTEVSLKAHSRDTGLISEVLLRPRPTRRPYCRPRSDLAHTRGSLVERQ